MQLIFAAGRLFTLMVAISVTTDTHAEITNVSCVYQTSVQINPDTESHHNLKGQMSKPNTWYFWRTAKQIEVANENMSLGEKWISNDQQTVFYQVLYHDKKFVLNFQPTDLRILGKQADWEIRSALFPKSILRQLQQKSTGKFHQYDTVRYEGIVAGASYQVDWIAELKLPFRVEKHIGNKSIMTELKEVYSLDKTPYKQLISDQYEEMDYADIGDNESHPIVAQLQKSIGIDYFHHH